MAAFLAALPLFTLFATLDANDLMTTADGSSSDMYINATKMVDCRYIDDCSDGIPDGRNYDGFVLFCDSKSCQYQTIYCSSQSCVINCGLSQACRYTKIVAPRASSVYVHCTADHACDHTTVNANQADTVDVKCHDSHSCYFMNINGYAAHIVSIDARYADYALYYGTVNASMAGSTKVTCSSDSYKWACYKPDWYFTEYATSTSIECYGHGCYHFGDIYTEGNVGFISVDIYGCGVCSSASSCVSSWTTKCDKQPYYYSDINFWSSNTFYGSYCSGSSCMCSTMASKTNYWSGDYWSGCNMTSSSGIWDTDTSAAGTVVGSVLGAMCYFGFIALVAFVIVRNQRTSSAFNGYTAMNNVAPVMTVQPQQQLQPNVIVTNPNPAVQQQQQMMNQHAVFQPAPVVMQQAQPQYVVQQQPQVVQQPMYVQQPVQAAYVAPTAPVMDGGMPVTNY